MARTKSNPGAKGDEAELSSTIKRAGLAKLHRSSSTCLLARRGSFPPLAFLFYPLPDGSDRVSLTPAPSDWGRSQSHPFNARPLLTQLCPLPPYSPVCIGVVQQ
eukprot:365893-Chlamydomonas_euryale.AAC.2